jgi:hypothetical protein
VRPRLLEQDGAALDPRALDERSDLRRETHAVRSVRFGYRCDDGAEPSPHPFRAKRTEHVAGCRARSN